MNDRNLLLAAVVALAVAAMACGINVPVTRIKTGPTQTVDLQVPLPEELSSGLELRLKFVAGELKLAPGATDYLATGTATFNVAEFEPTVQTAGSTYTVGANDLKIEGIPSVQGDLKNEWDLQLADTPMSLAIEAGAYSGNFELGGLSLEKLTISEGGSDVTCAFSDPNHVDMSAFIYNTGASSARLSGLANANFEQMTFTSGAGDYTLSFDGDLQQDASVAIDAGLGTVTIVVPEGVNARVTSDSSLSTVNAEPGWVQADKTYTLSGSGPTLTITVKMGAGTLNLKTEPVSDL